MVLYWTGLWNYEHYMMLFFYKNMIEGQGDIIIKKQYMKHKLKLQYR